MADSDDDGDYKRRDKFRTERRGYDGGSPRREWRGDARPPTNRESWDRSGTPSGGSREHRGRHSYSERRERYSPRRHEMSPPHKRIRVSNTGAEWEDRGGFEGEDNYGRGPASRSYVGGNGNAHRNSSQISTAINDVDVVQPPILSFKAYLSTQDDSISDEEAIKKYAEYKLEFRRQQINEFFVHHKDEEWFKLKYHPEESVKRKEEQRDNLYKRIEVFEKFMEEGKLEGPLLDADKSESLVKLLDSVVIMLEGGNDTDLQILDEVDEEGEKEGESTSGGRIEGREGERRDQEDEDEEGEENVKKEKKRREGKERDDETSVPLAEENKEKDESKNEQSSDALTKSNETERIELSFSNISTLTTSTTCGPSTTTITKRKRKRTKEFDESSSSSGSSEENEGKDSSSVSFAEVDENGRALQDEEERRNRNNDKEGEKDPRVEKDKRPRALHKTSSIFLRNLAPTITKQEVEAMCKRYPGFLRAAIADPQPERRWFRRGWVTFERSVKIKEICFNLNNIRLRECELGPIVNRDLSRRIRTVNGITVDKKIVRNDIKLAAKVITNLDKKWNLWSSMSESSESPSSSDLLGLPSNNPILKNITDYLIEEASAEEEELLGKNSELEDGEEGEDGNSISRDEELLRVLDKMLFYLRIVHSVDFYNHSEYPNEDEMPNRCGIMHARGIPPSSNITPLEIEDYVANFEKKIGSFLIPKNELNEEEAVKLGMKTEEDEVEKFVSANTQELGKDKWLCPLSGKKFKGPDFIRKHIFNKHGEKIDEVKREVKYYNNYLKDPKRPQLPENPQNKSGGGGSKSSRGSEVVGGSHSRGSNDPYQYTGQPREATSYPVYDDRRNDSYGRDRGYRTGGSRGGRSRDDFGGFRGRYDNFGSSFGGGGNARPIITYRDLDAPRDEEYF